MKDSEVLMKARELIAEEQHWCRRHFARDKHGAAVPYASAQACQFCSLGAVYAVEEADGYEGMHSATEWLDKVANRCGATMISFNDSRTTTHADVLRVFDEAIQLAKEAENEKAKPE